MVRIKCTLKSSLSRKPFSMLSNRQQRRISYRNLLNKKRDKNFKKNKRLVNTRIDEDEQYQNSTIMWVIEKSTPVNDFNGTSNDTCKNVFLFNHKSSISQARSNININKTSSHTMQILNNTEYIDVDRAAFHHQEIRKNTSIDIESIPHDEQCFADKNYFKNRSEGLQEFKDNLHRAFIECNLNHFQMKTILDVLRTHTCFFSLPKSSVTLLQTPRIFTGQIINVLPGQYLHFGLEKVLIKILKQTPTNLIPSEKIILDFNIDGCELNKKNEIIPIQVRISNIPESDPGIVGIYKGRNKPANVQLFLHNFITDSTDLQEKGLLYSNINLKVEFRIGIFDLVARADFLRHRNHNSKIPCSKCHVKGFRYKYTSVYPGIDYEPRNDRDYAQAVDKIHHIEKSPLVELGIGLVRQVPIDAMHCIYLGVHKNILVAWIKGSYGIKVKLPIAEINKLSERMLTVAKHCPREFARKPESLTFLKDYKATQHRQCLLYFGIVVTKGIVSENVYIHYLLFSTAVRYLSIQNASSSLLSFAKLALEQFILDADLVYDLNFISLNVHNLSHLFEDAVRYGPLDTYAAWPYENNMRFFRKCYRKPGQPLEQIHNRLKERENIDFEKVKVPKSYSHLKLFSPSYEGPLPSNTPDYILQTWKMYKNLELKEFTLGTNIQDNTCILQDHSICVIENIFKVTNNLIYLLLKKFRLAEDLYDIGIRSSSIGIYKCSFLESEAFLIEHSYVIKKCYRMPFWKDVDENDSSFTNDNDDPVCESLSTPQKGIADRTNVESDKPRNPQRHHSHLSQYNPSMEPPNLNIPSNRHLSEGLQLQENVIRNTIRTSEKTKTPTHKGQTYRQPYEPIPLVPSSNCDEKNFDYSKESAAVEASNSNNVRSSYVSSLPSAGYHRLPLNNTTSSTVTSRSMINHRSPSANVEPITWSYDCRSPCLGAYESSSTVSQGVLNSMNQTTNDEMNLPTMSEMMEKENDCRNEVTFRTPSPSITDNNIENVCVNYVNSSSKDNGIAEIDNGGWRTVLHELQNFKKEVSGKFDKVYIMLEDHIEGPDPEKPKFLPYNSPEEVSKFDKVDGELFKEVVKYYRWLGGRTLEDAVKICFNESITPSYANNYTMHGTSNTKRLYKTNFCKAIYKGLSKMFKPTKDQFRVVLSERLRCAKQTHRNHLQTSLTKEKRQHSRKQYVRNGQGFRRSKQKSCSCSRSHSHLLNRNNQSDSNQLDISDQDLRRSKQGSHAYSKSCSHSRSRSHSQHRNMQLDSNFMMSRSYQSQVTDNNSRRKYHNSGSASKELSTDTSSSSSESGSRSYSRSRSRSYSKSRSRYYSKSRSRSKSRSPSSRSI